MDGTDSSIHFLNLEYFFRLLYEALHGGAVIETANQGLDWSGILVLLSNIWLVVTIIAYLVTLFAIGLLVYGTMRIHQIREEEKIKYATITPEEAHEEVETSRWNYIQSLIESGQESDWRQAIIESDIILDEVLTRLGYPGDSVGEKLKAVNPARFGSLNNAWEAHKVRNEIAHQGSQYQLSEHLAHRTIANYEAVFREFEEL